MEVGKEEEMMPVWQNHEQRITTLENSFAGFSHKIDTVDNRMERLETKIETNNVEQKDLLNQLIAHHLATNKMKLSKGWQVVLNITGAGGILVAVIYGVVQLIQQLWG